MWLTWSLGPAAGVLAAAAVFIAVFGARLARLADRLADRTGLGEAVIGATLLGGTTSIAGLVVSIVAAAADNPSLAVSNSVGGIAAQTAFIVVADLVYRPANLEHAAASITNVFNSLLLLVLLAIVIMGAAAPPLTIAGVHPATLLLLGSYGYGVWLSREVQQHPSWAPEATDETTPDVPEEPDEDESLRGLWGRFAVVGLIVAVAGWLVGQAGLSVIEATALSGTLVGAFVTSVVTSLPELVTAVAAVRTGALTLAIGGIVGGNAFDVLFVAVADVVYRRGSLYEQMSQADLFVLGWTMVLVTVVSAGLVRRQRRGIGFEGVAILGLYVIGLLTVSAM